MRHQCSLTTVTHDQDTTRDECVFRRWAIEYSITASHSLFADIQSLLTRTTVTRRHGAAYWERRCFSILYILVLLETQSVIVSGNYQLSSLTFTKDGWRPASVCTSSSQTRSWCVVPENPRRWRLQKMAEHRFLFAPSRLTLARSVSCLKAHFLGASKRRIKTDS